MSVSRSGPIQRGKPLKRTPMKNNAVKRSWVLARAKVDEEGVCRVCGVANHLEAAHVIGQAKADRMDDTGKVVVNPDDILPLCSTCHRAFDSRKLDLLPFIYVHEQSRAVQVAGGIMAALRRISGSRES